MELIKFTISSYSVTCHLQLSQLIYKYGVSLLNNGINIDTQQELY